MPELSDNFDKAQAVEYGTWVAVSPIDHNGARAYNIGDPVPVSNVKAYGYDTAKLVAKTSATAPEKG